MTTIPVVTLFLAFFASALISPFLPFTLMWRTACISAGAFLAAHLLEQPVHWEDQNVGHALGLAMLLMFSSVVLVALTVRFLIVVSKGPLTQEVLGTGQYSDGRGWIDLINMVLWGGIAGILLVIGLARLLAGVPGGQTLDIGIALAGVAVVVFAAVRCSKKIAVPLGSLGIAVSVLSFIGSGQADRIMEGAETFAAGRPWCLVTPTTEAQEPAFSTLGFFSIPKGRSRAHLVVLVRDGDQLLKGHWSIRQQKIFEGAYGPVPTCNPETDYAATLAGGQIERERLAVGPHSYIVPPELEPVADIASLSVRGTMLTEWKQTYPEMSERIKIDFAAPDLFVPRDAKPLTDIPFHSEIDPAELTKGKSLEFSGTELSTGRAVVLE